MRHDHQRTNCLQLYPEHQKQQQQLKETVGEEEQKDETPSPAQPKSK